MPRVQTLVQLNDELLAILDERAAARGISRSEVIRAAIETYLSEQAEASLDEAIVEGYRRYPPDDLEEVTRALAVASIESEPW